LTILKNMQGVEVQAIYFKPLCQMVVFVLDVMYLKEWRNI
jgi:hypothetical protein